MNGCQESLMLEDALDANPITLIEKRAHHAEYMRRWTKLNRKKVREWNYRWRDKNRPLVNENEKKRRERNPERQKELAKRQNFKARSTIKGKLSRAMSHRMRGSLKASKSGAHWEELVDYTLGKLKKHLEKQFKDGMTWDNYGSYWHIDHIVPVKVFNYAKPEDIDFAKCWALKNLQPLEAKKNRIKNAKLTNSFQPSLTF